MFTRKIDHSAGVGDAGGGGGGATAVIAAAYAGAVQNT